MPPLADILARYPDTDKDTLHSYGATYADLFAPLRETARRVVEVGVRNGGSIRAWCDYFPLAEVVGLDDWSEVDPPLEMPARCRLYRCDQTTAGELLAAASLVAPADIVIDDGIHTLEAQRMTWEHLWPAVRPGGVYVVEDVQTEEAAEVFRGMGAKIIDLRGVKGRADDVLAVWRRPI